MRKVRVRFAPSPTGPLHIGGVRTALYNYLFAKNNGGDFILRIEDTDQVRTVEGAENYIVESLKWLGIEPDESPEKPGKFAPYRQSDRKEMYRGYAETLIEKGHAYYAFDTQEEIEEMKEKMIAAGVVQPQYNAVMRARMKNSLTLSSEEVNTLLAENTPYVIRVKMPAKEEIRFKDEIRDWVVVHSSTLDDKVLLKSDGMPTYHLANIVDDHLMEITHVIRGEEWLPSAPLHVLLYQFFGWEDTRPSFAHLPLLLKPDGKGKLSKRDGQKQGIPVFPLAWNDPETGESLKGFREEGYFAKAVVNFLALLGWSPSSDEEMFILSDLEKLFSLDRISKGGARFDIEKAKWFNEYYLRNEQMDVLAKELASVGSTRGINASESQYMEVVNLMKDRVTFIPQMIDSAEYLFGKPKEFDEKTIAKKWSSELFSPFTEFGEDLKKVKDLTSENAKNTLVNVLERHEMPLGKVMQALRLALTGQAGGPDLMDIIVFLGADEVASRIKEAIENFKIN